MIKTEEHGAVTLVRLDHGKVNALDIEILHGLTTTLRGLAADRAVLLTGTGKVFSAGVDLARMVAGGPAYGRAYLPALSTAFLAVFDHPGPVVAAVNGHAIAGGCVLAAACDVRLMSAGTIGLTEVLVGVPFPIAALEIMRSAVGPAAAALALTGRTVGPDEALRLGLVDEVVAPETLLDTALDRAAALARIPAPTYALTKEQLHRPVRQRIDAMRGVDDPRATDLWTADAAHTAMKRYLEDLTRTRRS